MLRLPRKIRLRCSKWCACHANAAGVHSTQSSPDFRGPLWRCSVCTFHAKCDGGAPSARLRCSKCCACHANAAGVHSTQSSPDFRGPLWRPVSTVFTIVAGLPRTSLEVLRVLHLPRKMSRTSVDLFGGGRAQYSIDAGLPRTSLEVLRVLHLPRKIGLMLC